MMMMMMISLHMGKKGSSLHYQRNNSLIYDTCTCLGTNPRNLPTHQALIHPSISPSPMPQPQISHPNHTTPNPRPTNNEPYFHSTPLFSRSIDCTAHAILFRTGEINPAPEARVGCFVRIATR